MLTPGQQQQHHHHHHNHHNHRQQQKHNHHQQHQQQPQQQLVGSYQHLLDLPHPQKALRILKWLAAIVKPLMLTHSLRVGVLAEFLPEQPNLLGLNIGHGRQVCIRLRPAADRSEIGRAHV